MAVVIKNLPLEKPKDALKHLKGDLVLVNTEKTKMVVVIKDQLKNTLQNVKEVEEVENVQTLN